MNKKAEIRRGNWPAMAAIAAASVSCCYGQQVSQAEEWRQRPQPMQVRGADSVPAAVRTSRDNFFDRVLGDRSPGGGSVWESVGPEPEVLASGTSAIVQFTSYATILSKSRRSVYTEIKMNAEQVLRDPSGTVQPGKPLTVILGGGTLQMPSGQILRRDLAGTRQFGLQPGHRYLVFLNYQSAGNYFLYDKSWDLTNGVAVPNTANDAARAKRGQSRLAGMSEEKFVSAVKTSLAQPVKPYDGK